MNVLEYKILVRAIEICMMMTREKKKKKSKRSISFIPIIVHGNYGQMIHNISSGQHSVNIFWDDDDDNMT
jgi:hypothetical protein